MCIGNNTIIIVIARRDFLLHRTHRRHGYWKNLQIASITIFKILPRMHPNMDNIINHWGVKESEFRKSILYKIYDKVKHKKSMQIW